MDARELRGKWKRLYVELVALCATDSYNPRRAQRIAGDLATEHHAKLLLLGMWRARRSATHGRRSAP